MNYINVNSKTLKPRFFFFKLIRKREACNIGQRRNKIITRGILEGQLSKKKRKKERVF
jgi:hypothetical protein